MNPLRDRMLVDLQLSDAQPITQKSYLKGVDNLAKYFNRSPEDLGEAEIKEYVRFDAEVVNSLQDRNMRQTSNSTASQSQAYFHRIPFSLQSHDRTHRRGSFASSPVVCRQLFSRKTPFHPLIDGKKAAAPLRR